MEIPSHIIRSLAIDDLSYLEAHFPELKEGTHAKRLLLQEKGRLSYNGIIVDGAIAGVQLIRWDGPVDDDHRGLSTYPEIGSVYVLPEFRKQGLASALLRNSERLIKEQGHEAAGLLIKDSNTPSINLHKKEGYVAVGKANAHKDSPDEPRTYFVKQL